MLIMVYSTTRYYIIDTAKKSLPILCNVERPFEQEMGLVVVVDELGDSVVVSSGEHSGGGLFGVDYNPSGPTIAHTSGWRDLHFFS
jgi:hypothetical protein